MVPNPNYLLSAVPVDCQYFSGIDLCSAFFSIFKKEEEAGEEGGGGGGGGEGEEEKTEIFLCFHLGIYKFTGTVMPRGYTERPTYCLRY